MYTFYASHKENKPKAFQSTDWYAIAGRQAVRIADMWGRFPHAMSQIILNKPV